MSDAKDENRPEELISRIRAEAEREAEKIRSDAEKSIEDRKKSLEKRLAEIREKADARIAEERKQLVSRTDAQIALLEGRAALRREDRIYREAIDRTRDAIRELRGTERYPAILARWIVEAALGLGSVDALVLAAEDDQRFLTEAIEIARGKLADSGSEVSLRVDADSSPDPSSNPDSDSDPRSGAAAPRGATSRSRVSGQGVVLRDSSGRRSFSNLVEDRLRRYGSDLRRVIYHQVIEDES